MPQHRHRTPERFWTTLLAAGAWLSLMGASCIPQTGSPTTPKHVSCVGFQDLNFGDRYAVGSTFTSSAVTVTTNSFIWSNGGTTSNGFAEVEAGGLGGGSGNEMEVNNINLQFDFGGPLAKLMLLFGEYGGNLNLEVNGDFANFANLVDIDGTSIGGVTVGVPAGGNGNDAGELVLNGNVMSFSIGGQELWIDDVCGQLQ